jgi:hypothetical protein
MKRVQTLDPRVRVHRVFSCLFYNYLFYRTTMFVKLPDSSVPPQARAVDLATQIPSKSLHLRSLDNALRFTYNSLMYVLYALGQWTNEEWPPVEDTVAQHLATGTMFLGGALDGLIIAALPPHQPPSTSMSFERTAMAAARSP